MSKEVYDQIVILDQVHGSVHKIIFKTIIKYEIQLHNRTIL